MNPTDRWRALSFCFASNIVHSWTSTKGIKGTLVGAVTLVAIARRMAG